MIIGTMFLMLLLVWAFEYIRIGARILIPVSICLFAGTWIGYTIQDKHHDFSRAFYMLAWQLGLDVVQLFPWLVIYACAATLLHCWRRA
jgi:hypothetical protein